MTGRCFDADTITRLMMNLQKSVVEERPDMSSPGGLFVFPSFDATVLSLVTPQHEGKDEGCVLYHYKASSFGRKESASAGSSSLPSETYQNNDAINNSNGFSVCD